MIVNVSNGASPCMKPRGNLKLYPCGAKSFFEEFFIEMHAINDEPLIEGVSFHMKPGGGKASKLFVFTWIL